MGLPALYARRQRPKKAKSDADAATLAQPAAADMDTSLAAKPAPSQHALQVTAGGPPGVPMFLLELKNGHAKDIWAHPTSHQFAMLMMLEPCDVMYLSFRRPSFTKHPDLIASNVV